MNGKKVLILGGFPQMIDIVMTAKRMGMYTIVVDRDAQSPAKRFADEAIDISTDQIDALYALCVKKEVDGIFNGFEDFNIHIAQSLCSRLNLPFYATKEQLEKITDKSCFKKHCRMYGVPVIEEYSLHEAIGLGKYPYIVKPSDSYGSRGITVCYNEKQLISGYQKALASSHGKKVVVERFIDTNYGTELFYTAVNGTIHLTATADRYVVRNGETAVPLPVAEVFPSRHRDEMAEAVDPSIRKMLHGMGIQNGLILIQMLYQDGEFFVYEMAYRFTGEQHYRLVEKQHGVSLGKMMLKYCIGEDISAYDNELLDDTNFIKPAINLAVLLKPGTIQSIAGLEQVYQIDEVISYNLTHKTADCITARGDYSHMLIRVNMVASDYPHLCGAVKQVADSIRVTDTNGDNMLVPVFRLPEV